MKTTIHFIILSALCTPVTWAALALQSYDAASHYRFADDPAFIGNGYDWSGIAYNGDWFTRISDTYYVTAWHARATGSATFYESNDLLGPSVTVSAPSLTRLGTTDIAIGRFSSSPGSNIAIYGIASEPTTQATFTSSSYYEMEAFIVGLNGSGGNTTTNFRVGRNELDGFYDDVALTATNITDTITFDDDRGTGQSLGADEAYLQSGDSGGPTFITVGSDLVLTSIHLGIDGTRSYDSFLPNYIAEISAIVEAGGESLTLISPVPEPSTAVLLWLASLSLMHRRRVSQLPL
ncbi:MAG: hypothetical protein P8P36_08070 [Akkermansiaceae bacterium]|nr:hypothetical protein [Akkermansiaceae bacterium]